MPPDPLWPDRVRALAQRLGSPRDLAPDAVLYLLLYAAARRVERYSSHHALVCAAMARECATRLSWPDNETQSLVLAALTMNVSITALQEELVFRERTPTPAQRLRSMPIRTAASSCSARTATVAGANRTPYATPVLLDTNVSGSRVTGAAGPSESRIALDHDRLLMLLSGSLAAQEAPAQAASRTSSGPKNS